jgi:hypothetical protein
MEIIVQNRKKSIEKLSSEYPGSEIIDVTSKSANEFVRFSPFYPHGNIPVPFSNDIYAESVEGIWQGLKVFETQGIDKSKFFVKDMKNLKRTVRKYGPVLGHQKGVNGDELLGYYEARINIYLPSYAWVLNSVLKDLTRKLEEIAKVRPLILLDYETNQDISNISKPLSHASLIKNFIENNSSLKY